MKHFLWVLLLAFGLTTAAAAADPEIIRADLAKRYEGTFAWDGASDLQSVSITLNSVTTEGEGRVVALGNGTYIADGKTTSITVKCVINAASLRFEMWESAPQTRPGENFITDGSHVGSISEDLTTIRATWTTRGAGTRGTLQLRSR